MMLYFAMRHGNGENKWVLMVDAFRLHPNNMGFSETKDFKTFKNLGHFNDGVMKAVDFFDPKHGAVMPLTQDEARRLADHWELKPYGYRRAWEMTHCRSDGKAVSPFGHLSHLPRAERTERSLCLPVGMRRADLMQVPPTGGPPR